MNAIVEPGLGLFVWTAITFLILLFMLSKYAWKPILKAVNDRESSIEEALNQAKKAREEMSSLKAENEQIIKQARTDRDEILKEARELKEKIITEAQDTAKAEANRIIESAKRNIENEKLAAITEIKNQVANLSIDIAEKVLAKELTDKKEQEILIDSLIKQSNLN